MRFDLVLTNPPFQDTVNRGRTPHKLWIDFTLSVWERMLTAGGALCQVSPASFQSPSSKVISLMRQHRTAWITLDAGKHFPRVGSTFAAYLIYKEPNSGSLTHVMRDGEETEILLDQSVFYIPTDGPIGLSIHKKVIFEHKEKIAVEWDYVTAHNILLRDVNSSLSKEATPSHPYELFHTNGQRWWSSRQQEFARYPKVMWTRSGYQRPFFDNGKLGGTDMAYFVRVPGETEGANLAANLNLKLMRYIFATAKWSGFGNEKVFAAIPKLPQDKSLTDQELYEMFGISSEEVEHVEQSLATSR